MCTVLTLVILMLCFNNILFLCCFKTLFNSVFLVTYNLYSYFASSIQSWMQCLNSKQFWHLTFSLFSLCGFQAMNQYMVVITFFLNLLLQRMICSVKKERGDLEIISLDRSYQPGQNFMNLCWKFFTTVISTTTLPIWKSLIMIRIQSSVDHGGKLQLHRVKPWI